jgi:hypothetical protein
MKQFALFLMLLSLSVFVLGCAGCTTEKPVTPPAEQETPGPETGPVEEEAPAEVTPPAEKPADAGAPEPAVPGDAE